MKKPAQQQPGQREAYENNQQVLVTKTSRLASVIILEKKRLIYTIDSDYFIRIWDIKTGKSITSFLLDLNRDRKLTRAVVDKEEKYLAVANDIGEISIHNVHSTGVLHVLEKLNTEVTNMKFFVGATNFWLAATCWEGKVAFFNVPAFTQNRYQVKSMVKQEGFADSLALDICEVYMATAGVDNRVLIWNTFTASLKQKIQLPKRDPGVYVTAIKFLPQFQNYFLVIQSNGDVYVVNPISGQLLVQIENLFEEQPSIAVNDNIIIAAGESGMAQVFRINIELTNHEMIEKQKRSSFLNQSMVPTVDFDKLAEFQAHEINLQKDQSVIGVKYLFGESMFSIFTNHGVVKLFSSSTYEHIATLNDANWDYENIEAALIAGSQPRELTFSEVDEDLERE